MVSEKKAEMAESVCTEQFRALNSVPRETDMREIGAQFEVFEVFRRKPPEQSGHKARVNLETSGVVRSRFHSYANERLASVDAIV